jgi:hypothetical protein
MRHLMKVSTTLHKLEVGKTVKLSIKTHNWLTKQSHEYGQSLDQIFTNVVEELEELT